MDMVAQIREILARLDVLEGEGGYSTFTLPPGYSEVEIVEKLNRLEDQLSMLEFELGLAQRVL